MKNFTIALCIFTASLHISEACGQITQAMVDTMTYRVEEPIGVNPHTNAAVSMYMTSTGEYYVQYRISYSTQYSVVNGDTVLNNPSNALLAARHVWNYDRVFADLASGLQPGTTYYFQLDQVKIWLTAGSHFSDEEDPLFFYKQNRVTPYTTPSLSTSILEMTSQVSTWIENGSIAGFSEKPMGYQVRNTVGQILADGKVSGSFQINIPITGTMNMVIFDNRQVVKLPVIVQ